eukprot:TRINITY_DN15656_c0_g1_i1.p2 TRINITY_DN15656_c0_g1~~TRINITY_DN15656_c0_g1_i1.p2  ORF type:complete len:125 (-),score=32.97 TRINITY_DN15656_c0_g1_i1:525-899(-)
MSLLVFCVCFFFFFKQKTAYEMLRSLVGSEMCIRDSSNVTGPVDVTSWLEFVLSSHKIVGVVPIASIASTIRHKKRLATHAIIILQHANPFITKHSPLEACGGSELHQVAHLRPWFAQSGPSDQ